RKIEPRRGRRGARHGGHRARLAGGGKLHPAAEPVRLERAGRDGRAPIPFRELHLILRSRGGGVGVGKRLPAWSKMRGACLFGSFVVGGSIQVRPRAVAATTPLH